LWFEDLTEISAGLAAYVSSEVSKHICYS